MKKIVLIIVVIILSVFTYNNYALAMRCEKYEYGELKDMDRQHLNITYCGLKIFYDGNLDLIKGGNTSADISKDFNECGDQMMKALRAYRAKYKKNPIDCDKLPKYKHD